MCVTKTETDSGASNNMYTDLNASQLLTNDVATLIKSDRVMGDTAKDLNMQSLAAFGVTVASETTTRVITLSISGEDAEAAAVVANKLAENASDVAQEVMNVQSVNVIDKAIAPSSPSGPNRPVYVAVAFMAGLFLAVAIVVLADMLNTKVRRTEEVEGALGHSGYWPYACNEGGQIIVARSRNRSLKLEAQNAAKTLLANIRFARSVDNPISSLVVTSSIPNEGKSTVSVNLAEAIATSGKSVLLVECDFRNRSLADMLNVRAPGGIYAVLSEEMPLDQAVSSTSVPNMYLLDVEPHIPNHRERFVL